MEKLISVIVPCYNEERNIAVFYQELAGVLGRMPYRYEIIFIDDGSIDKTYSVLKEIAVKDKSVRIIKFKRNYGQTAAIVAGIDNSNGDFVVMMDADLQNDPNDIQLLMRKMEEGYDMVSGWRKKRLDPFWNRTLPSHIANAVISTVTGVRLHDYGCTLKLYKREFLKNINLYGEMHRFIPVYVYWRGGKIAEVEVNHRKRQWGKSKYGINRALKVILDLMTVKFLLGYYSTSPLYFFGRWGFLLFAAGGVCTVVTLVEKIAFGVWVHKNPLMLLAVFSFILGAQIFLMGLIAELNMRIYYETTKKTIYTVDESA